MCSLRFQCPSHSAGEPGPARPKNQMNAATFIFRHLFQRCDRVPHLLGIWLSSTPGSAPDSTSTCTPSPRASSIIAHTSRVTSIWFVAPALSAERPLSIQMTASRPLRTWASFTPGTPRTPPSVNGGTEYAFVPCASQWAPRP